MPENIDNAGVGRITGFSKCWYTLEDGKDHIIYLNNKYVPEYTACGKNLCYPDEHQFLATVDKCGECIRWDIMRDLAE